MALSEAAGETEWVLVCVPLRAVGTLSPPAVGTK